jgi:hypothetical protein
MRVKPAIIGLITSIAMIAIILLSFNLIIPDKLSPENFVYILYGAGIAWTLISYNQSAENTGKFKDSFQHGFKTFIVITLVMALFTFVFNYLHPEFAKEAAQAYGKDLVNQKNKTPKEIEEAVIGYEKQFPVMLLSSSIFAYLIFGSVVTAVTSLFLTRRK